MLDNEEGFFNAPVTALQVGDDFYLLMPTVATDAFSVALHEFATCVALVWAWLTSSSSAFFCWLTRLAGMSVRRCVVHLA